MPSPKTTVADIIDRRNESRLYFQNNYWNEFEDVYRAVKCRTKPIMIVGKDGTQVEDTTRTNVCMPEISLMRRRKVARLTANAPQINYTTPNGPEDPVASKLTARAYQIYDRSGEAIEHRRVVDSGATFGRGISKLRYDTIEVMRRIRRQVDQFGDRKELMQFQGRPQAQIDEELSQYGTQLDDDYIKQLMLDSGRIDVEGQANTVKYSGPIVTAVFIGDFFDEPGCRTLNESAWAIESFVESDLFLQKMLRRKYLDPETGELKSVFSVKACEELFDMPSQAAGADQQQPFDLRTRLRQQAMAQTVPLHPSRLVPGKRFNFLESHQRDEYGQMWKTWVGNEKVLMGRMPYQSDLYGKYEYTEFVPMPDMLNSVGDSMPRLMRWLHFLHNTTVGQRKDLVAQILRPMMKQLFGEDIPDEVLERKLMRVIQVKSMNSLQPLIESPSIGQALASANEEEAQILRMLSMAEPSLNTVDTGSDSNPMAGKLATTAVLNAKAADTLTQDELNQLNLYLKELGEKKLWMDQQQMEGPVSIQSQYVAKVQGLSERYGKASSITLDWQEIQEDIQVEPEAGSMLSVDDELRRNAAMQFYAIAAQDPSTFNKQYAAQFLASTIRGIDPAKAINPPAPPSPPPPKANIAISVKWPELPPEVQAQLVQGMGGQVGPEILQHLDEQQALQDVKDLSEASDAAENLTSQAHKPEPQESEDQLGPRVQ